MRRFTPSRPQLILLALSVVALAAAEYLRYQPMAERAQTVTGGVEVVTAIVTGVLFVVLSYRYGKAG